MTPSEATWPAAPGSPAFDGTRLVVLVGLTGAGKTTLVRALGELLSFELLPNRRELTDVHIIGYLQREDGVAPRPVRDRAQRFAMTRRYRELFPGGMAEALRRHWTEIAGGGSDQLRLFDGLRGESELDAASRLFPSARFLVLRVPFAVRLLRLLDRSDPFDRAGQVAPADGLRWSSVRERLEASGRLTQEEMRSLSKRVERGEFEVEQVATQAKTLLAEAENYSLEGAVSALERAATGRYLLIDGDRCSPVESARLAADFLISEASP